MNTVSVSVGNVSVSLLDLCLLSLEVLITDPPPVPSLITYIHCPQVPCFNSHPITPVERIITLFPHQPWP